MTRYLLSFAVAASCAACASILDFQEPTDKASAPDAGVAAASTATTDTTPIATHPSDAGVADSGSTIAPQKNAGALVDLDASADVCACPPDVSADWQGPFAIATSTNGAPATCGGAFPTEAFAGFTGLSAGAAECSCSCGEPANVACSTPTTTFYSDAACTASCQSSTTALLCAAATTYTCDLLGLVKPQAMAVGASVPSGGSCSPQPTVTVPPQTWSSSVRLCGGAPACSSGDGGTCVTPSTGFSATNRCVMKAGQNACPAGFPVKQELHQGGTDTRACTACTCGGPTNVACTPTLSTFSGASCNGSSTDVAAPTGCLAVTNSTHLNVDAGTPTGGSCLAAGGVATGAFTEDAPTTVCCLE